MSQAQDHGAGASVDVSEIDGVLEQLDRIINQAIDEPNRIGYFAAMYRKVTDEIRTAVLAGRFQDGPRMVTLDRVFAERFIDAHDTWRQGRSPTKSWQVAFEAAGQRRLLILQHLLIGMNAHINLDLGIAAATVTRDIAARADSDPAVELADLKADFDTINDVLASLSAGFESVVGDLSPWIGVLERVGKREGDIIVNWSIGRARDAAWLLAKELAPNAPVDQAPTIAERDEVTELLAKTVRRTGVILPVVLLAIRARETNDIATVIRHLEQA